MARLPAPVVLVLLAVVVAGCGGTPTPDPGPAPSPTAGTASPTPTATPTPPAATPSPVPSLAVEPVSVEPGGTALLAVTAANASAVELRLPEASTDALRVAVGDAQATPSASYVLPGEAPVWVWSGRPERVELLVPVTVGPDVAPGDYRVRVRASPTPGSSIGGDAVTVMATVRVVRPSATPTS